MSPTILARIAIFVLAVAGFVAIGITLARPAPSPEWNNAPPAVKNWFNDPKVSPCCNTADGHRTIWQATEPPIKGYQYSVQIDNKWVPVPDAAVIRGVPPNPEGVSIVWYTRNYVTTQDERIVGYGYIIRCFIPGPGA